MRTPGYGRHIYKGYGVLWTRAQPASRGERRKNREKMAGAGIA
jgi:hypothetical protein